MNSKNKFISVLLCSFSVVIILGLGAYQLHQPQPPTRPHIVINSIMKCGSTYVTKVLRASLKYHVFRHETHDGPVELDAFFKNKDKLLKLHVLPDQIDVANYLKYSNKMIFQVRDPRQTILSLVYHLRVFKNQPNVPINFVDYDLSSQIDWVINNRLEETVAMINKWIAFKEEQDKLPNGLKILLVTYDELLENERLLFDRIISFYDIPKKMFNYNTYYENEEREKELLEERELLNQMYKSNKKTTND